MVARFVRDEEAVGSNPATPTSRISRSGPLCGGAFFVFDFSFAVFVQRKCIERSPDPLVVVRRPVRIPVAGGRGLLVAHDLLHVVDGHARRDEARGQPWSGR